MKTAREPIGAKLLCMKKPIISCAGNGSLEGVPNVSHDFMVCMDITPKRNSWKQLFPLCYILIPTVRI